MTAKPLILVQEVSKQFGKVQALSNVSVEVAEGELFGLIGPDGAGKTTLMRLITTLLVPNQGMVSVMGFDSVTEYRNIRSQIGFMPGSYSIYNDLSIRENLDLYANIFGTSLKAGYENIRDVYVQIEPFKNRPAGKLSGGMRQKLALCCAIIHNPRLLVLDEPTTGVDAVSRREFWEILRKMNQQGVTTLVSTPYMDEAQLCSRVALMQNGRLLAVDTPGNLNKHFDKELFLIYGSDNYELLTHLRKASFCHSVYPFGQNVHMITEPGTVNEQMIIDYLQTTGISAIQVKKHEAGIEDCFMYLARREQVSL